MAGPEVNLVAVMVVVGVETMMSFVAVMVEMFMPFPEEEEGGEEAIPAHEGYEPAFSKTSSKEQAIVAKVVITETIGTTELKVATNAVVP